MKSFIAVSATLLVSTAVSSAYAQTGTAVVDKPVKIARTSVISDASGHYVPNAAIDFATLTKSNTVTVLIFVANRCGVTWLYGDKITSVIKDYSTSKRVKFIAVHSSFEESDKEIVDGLKEHRVSIDLIDDKPAQKLADYFNASVTPYFVVIDQKGVLRYKGPYDKMGGSMAENQRPQYLRPALDAVLAGKPVAQKTVRALGCEITRRPKKK